MTLTPPELARLWQEFAEAEAAVLVAIRQAKRLRIYLRRRKVKMRLTKQMRKTLQTMRTKETWTVQELTHALGEPESSVRGRLQRAKGASWVVSFTETVAAWPLTVWQITRYGESEAVKP